MAGLSNVAELLGVVQPESQRTELPKPSALLVAKNLTVVTPGEKQSSLKSISLKVEPGQPVRVIGPSGAGKSTLARTLVGVWRPAGGSMRLGGAAREHYGSEVLGHHIGYLPQSVSLFDGTIAQSIARLVDVPDDGKVVTAAKMAAAHEIILELPNGYETDIQAGQVRLSGGQMQRSASPLRSMTIP